MHKSKYMLLQFALFAVPPLLAASLLEVNSWIGNPWTEFSGYVCGISGLLVVGLSAELLKPWLPETIPHLAFIALYTAAVLGLAHKYYQPNNKRIYWVSGLNLLVSLWSVAFGILWMFAAMQ